MKVELKHRRFANSNDAIFKTNLASLKCDSSSLKCLYSSQRQGELYLVYQKTITDVNVAISISGTGHLPSFFVPTPGHLDSLCVPIPGNLPIKKKKNANARGLTRGGGGDGHCWN